MPFFNAVKFGEFIGLYDLPYEEKAKRGLTTMAAMCRHLYIDKITYKSYAKKLEAARASSSQEDYGSFMGYMKELAFTKGALGKDRELYARLNGWLIDKKEETHKFEFTVADKTRIAREVIEGLREQYQRNGGSCPVCGFSQALCLEPRMDTKPEHTADNEMATVGLSIRPS